MKQTLRIILASFLATAAVIKAVPALAEPAQPNVNVSIVRTADLDLSTNAGRHQLEQRLVIASREVCGTASDFDLEGKNEVRACRDKVLTRAHADRDQLLASADHSVSIRLAAAGR